jgi:hypothetical protein
MTFARGLLTMLAIVGAAAACGNAAPIPQVSSVYPNGGPAPPPPPPRGDEFARGKFRSPLSVADAEQILLRTRVFEIGGMPPKRQVQAYNVIADQPDARARFESIAVRAEPAGRLYALCGLIALRSDLASTVSAGLAANGHTLTVFDSDEVSDQSASQLLDLIQRRRLWDEMRAARREVAAYFADVPLTPAARDAVNRYTAMINSGQSEIGRAIESAFSAIAPMREAVMSGGRFGHNQLETLSEVEFDRLAGDLRGVVLGRSEIVFVEPDAPYFAKLAATDGDEADRAFFEALTATRPRPVWSVYVEQQTDFSGCIRFGSMALVDTYRRWLEFRRQFPDRYAAGVRAEIDAVSFQLTESTCACGDLASVERELDRFVRDYPSAPIRSKVEIRLKAVRARTSLVRANCKSG